MQSISAHLASKRENSPLRWGILAGVLFNFILIFSGLIRTPTAMSASPNGWQGILGASLVLLIYALAAWFSPLRAKLEMRLSLRFGLIIGLVFLIQMLIEYLTPITSDQDGTLAIFSFGSLFVLLFLAGAIATFRTGSIRSGILTALWSALLGSLLWVGLLWVTAWIFSGTPQEAHFFEIDQTLVDFKASGMTDFRAFLTQDYLGATFFHPVLQPLAGLLLGSLGSLLAHLLLRLRRGRGGNPVLD